LKIRNTTLLWSRKTFFCITYNLNIIYYDCFYKLFLLLGSTIFESVQYIKKSFAEIELKR